MSIVKYKNISSFVYYAVFDFLSLSLAESF
jgi:hypothetical protein